VAVNWRVATTNTGKNADDFHNSPDTGRLILASLIPLAAFALQWVFWEAIQPFVWFLFYPAVFFSSRIGGFRAGLVATAISTVIVWWFFLPTRFSFALERSASALSMGIFTILGVLFSLTHERLRKANQQAKAALAAVNAAKEHLEERISERTADLARKSEALRMLNAELEQRVRERTDQLEAANAELKSLFESLPGLYLLLTPDLKIVAVSDAYLKATLTTREGILDRNLFDVFPDNPDDPGTTAVANMQTSMDRVLRNAASDTMAIAKHDVRGPDGVFVERYWSPINSPIFGPDRQIRYIVHRVEEVTEFVRQKSLPAGDTAELRIRMEKMEAEVFHSSQKVRVANQQLETANKELEAFSYSVSHDLRAPLRAIDGYSHILLEDHASRLDAEGKRVCSVISESARNMGKLIDDLLAFSRVGRTAIQSSAIDMAAMARSIFFELTTPEGRERVDFQVGPLPSAVGDPTLIRQVWRNLLSNAVKFSSKKERSVIDVGASRQGDEMVFSIRDNGAGFDMKYADKLFGVFQRLHSMKEFEGTGVGLAIVQRILHRHGGRVWAEGDPGKGASLHFTMGKGGGS